jgi:hypothetical protein
MSNWVTNLRVRLLAFYSKLSPQKISSWKRVIVWLVKRGRRKNGVLQLVHASVEGRGVITNSGLLKDGCDKIFHKS